MTHHFYSVGQVLFCKWFDTTISRLLCTPNWNVFQTINKYFEAYAQNIFPVLKWFYNSACAINCLELIAHVWARMGNYLWLSQYWSQLSHSFLFSLSLSKLLKIKIFVNFRNLTKKFGFNYGTYKNFKNSFANLLASWQICLASMIIVKNSCYSSRQYAII